MNYMYTAGSYAVPDTSPTVVWIAIRQGEVTASTDGSFAVATVNGTYPGYTTTVPRNSTVSVFVTGTPAFLSYTNAEVTIFLNGYLQTSQIVPLSGGNFTRTYSITVPADGYIRVEVHYGIADNYSGYCFVNPVFIDTY